MKCREGADLALFQTRTRPITQDPRLQATECVPLLGPRRSHVAQIPRLRGVNPASILTQAGGQLVHEAGRGERATAGPRGGTSITLGMLAVTPLWADLQALQLGLTVGTTPLYIILREAL